MAGAPNGRVSGGVFAHEASMTLAANVTIKERIIRTG
jgi:hypothetical protein